MLQLRGAGALDRRLRWHTHGLFHTQLDALREGFDAVLPVTAVRAALTPAQVLLMLNGEADTFPGSLSAQLQLRILSRPFARTPVLTTPPIPNAGIIL